MTDVSNTDDVIDSRDVIARIEELEAELEDAVLTDDGWVLLYTEDRDSIDMDAEHEELEALKALAEEGENCCSWEDGETMISENYFERYAEEYASDVGAISGEHQWPLDCIDWEKAADELKMAYSSVDFDGVTFWVLSS